MSEPGFIKRAYNVIRPFLPLDYGEFNGVRVKAVRKLDRTRSFPEYEAALCDLINSHLEGGMKVVEVGGGRGVSAVHISRVVGQDGSLTVFEGSYENVELVRDTLRVNEFPSEIKVRNGVVGTKFGLYGEPLEAENIEPADLPDCDALVLDCEGTEIEILAELTQKPSTIIVETHDRIVPGCESAVRCLLADHGYRIVERRRDEDRIFVLAAELQ